MNKLAPILALSLALAGCHPAAEEEEAAVESVAAVKVQPLTKGSIEETITAYGSVVAEPGKTVGLSVPYESAILRTFVVPGQRVKAGDVVVEVSASAATELQVGQAESTLKTAQAELRQAKQRYDLKLATNQDLNVAQRAADDAQLQLDNLQGHGATGKVSVKSPVDGVVTTLTAQADQIMAASGTLAEIVGGDAIEARVNVEPPDLDALHAGDTMRLTPVNQARAGTVTGTVRLVTASVNPTSRLVDVFVQLPKDSGFLLGGYVQAEFARKSDHVWVVPIAALLNDGEESRIFLAKNGRAVARAVEVGLRNKDYAEISGGGLQGGESIVVDGNYELEDGMGVKVK